MADRNLILVTGATGAQGGSVARHLLARGKFAVRCLTRNPESERAAALRQAGAEVVKGDLDDIGSLRTALTGCYGAFGVTNYWEHFEREYEQGKNLIDAVADSGVQHFVLSTLPYAKKISNGTLEVPHFDMKGMLEEYARDRIPGTTFVHVAYYFENFLAWFAPRKQPDGTYAFGFPQGDTPLAGVAVEDVGGVVAVLFEHPEKYKARTVGIVGADLPPRAYAEAMARVLGEKVVYNYIPREVFASFGFPGAEDLANMFEFNRLYIPNRRAELEESRALYARMQTFEAWLNAHKDSFRDALQG